MKVYKKTLIIILAAVVILSGTTGFAGLPGYENVYGPVITPEEAHKILIPRFSAKGETKFSTDSAVITEEIKSLARGLKNDPDLIYAFVQGHIKYALLFGDVKGAAATLTDRAGNDFDQSSLMIAMLREAGFTANYVYGVIRLNPAEVLSWIGTDIPGRLLTLLPSAGIPAKVYINSADELAYIDFDHVWVKVNIEGTDYMFDPSVKNHIRHPGLDLETITGFDRTQFVTEALAGSTDGTQWIQNVSKNTIQNNLSSMAMNLVDHIRTIMPASLNEVVGGNEIIRDSSQHRQTSLPYQQSITAEWTQIPTSFKTALTIQLPGIDQTLYSSGIYGKRLTLFYNAANQPELRLDGSLLETGSAVSPGTNQTIAVNVNHPYAGSGGAYGDASGTINIRAGGSFIFVNGWGEISQNMVEKYRKFLEQNMYSTGLEISEPVLGESLAML
ncbi:MAG: transglutaminase domain-containing protein, partial [Desulfobacterales bacterium]|nr:transglutaminase domain-containing protein [Desulfobacterales bacterium]